MRPSNSAVSPYPKCPAIIFNNRSSMVAHGRLQKTMDIIRDIAGMERHGAGSGADFYVSDARTGLPDFVTHIDIEWPAYSAPLIPMITGHDYINTMALAAVISEYPAGVHIIDDGDGITEDIAEALHLLKDMKNPAYMNPVTLYYVRDQSNWKGASSLYEEFMRMVPEDAGFNTSMYHAIPQSPHRSTEWQRDKRLPY